VSRYGLLSFCRSHTSTQLFELSSTILQEAEFWRQRVGKETNGTWGRRDRMQNLFSRENLDRARASLSRDGPPSGHALPSFRSLPSSPMLMASPSYLGLSRRPSHMHLAQTTPFGLYRTGSSGMSVRSFTEHAMRPSLSRSYEASSRDMYWREPPHVFRKHLEATPRTAFTAMSYSAVPA
jgi:hypothetical protein